MNCDNFYPLTVLYFSIIMGVYFARFQVWLKCFVYFVQQFSVNFQSKYSWYEYRVTQDWLHQTFLNFFEIVTNNDKKNMYLCIEFFLSKYVAISISKHINLKLVSTTNHPVKFQKRTIVSFSRKYVWLT